LKEELNELKEAVKTVTDNEKIAIRNQIIAVQNSLTELYKLLPRDTVQTSESVFSDAILARFEEALARSSNLITFADTSFNSPNVPHATKMAESLGVAVSVGMVIGNPVRNTWQYYLALMERRLTSTEFKIIRSSRTNNRICVVRRDDSRTQLLVITDVTNNRYMKAVYVIFAVQCFGDMQQFIDHYQEYMTDDNMANCCALATPPFVGN